MHDGCTGQPPGRQVHGFRSAGAFDDNVGGLDDGDRQDPGFQAQVVDRLGGHQRDHPVGRSGPL